MEKSPDESSAIPILFGILVVASLFLGCSSADSTFNRVTPQEVAMSAELLENLETTILENYDHINSIIVLREGKVLLDKYNNGFNQNSLYLTAFVTKTVTAILIGSAIPERHINSVNDFCVEYLSLEDYTITVGINNAGLEKPCFGLINIHGLKGI